MELTIRPWRDDEEDEFVAFATDGRVTAKVGDGSRWSEERARTRFRRARTAVQAGRGCWWRAGDPEDGLVGLLVAELEDDDGALEIGYWIVPTWWGQGCASQVVGIAVPRLTAAFPGTDLRAEAHGDNVASVAVLLSNGFVEEEPGVGRHDMPVRRFRRRADPPS